MDINRFPVEETKCVLDLCFQHSRNNFPNRTTVIAQTLAGNSGARETESCCCPRDIYGVCFGILGGRFYYFSERIQ